MWPGTRGHLRYGELWGPGVPSSTDTLALCAEKLGTRRSSGWGGAGEGLLCQTLRGPKASRFQVFFHQIAHKSTKQHLKL